MGVRDREDRRKKRRERRKGEEGGGGTGEVRGKAGKGGEGRREGGRGKILGMGEERMGGEKNKRRGLSVLGEKYIISLLRQDVPE